jgi:hypothetical protein
MEEMTAHTAIRRIGEGFFEQYNLDIRIVTIEDGLIAAHNFNANYPNYQTALEARNEILQDFNRPVHVNNIGKPT